VGGGDESTPPRRTRLGTDPFTLRVSDRRPTRRDRSSAGCEQAL